MSAEITEGTDVTEVSYSYDANGRRTGKTVERTGSNSEEITDETEYVWYGDIIYYEKHTETVTDLSGTTSSSQVMTTMYGQSGIVARNDDIYATDGHGSVRRKYSQNTTDEYDYHAFGDEIDPDSTDTNPYRYCGEYTDSESGLIYLRNRYYDPAAGRFISEDPAKDGLNWYAYCGNNPVGFVDPLGLYAEGDENLPYLINYIINGADGKTGGLTAQWYAAKTQEEKNRINKVANMLRCETTDFDITKSSSVLLLLDENGANVLGKSMGHMAVLIRNSDGQGIYFSYAGEDGTPIDDGKMSMDILSKDEVDNFMQTGNLMYTYASNGTLNSSNYTQYAVIDIDSNNGSAMIGKGIYYFWHPGTYSVAGHQCDNIASSIMGAGGKAYDVQWRPKASFEHAIGYFGVSDRRFER